METNPSIVVSDATLDMDISPLVATKDLKPEVKETPLPPSSHASTSQNQDTLVSEDVEFYPSKYRPLVKAILQLSNNRAKSRVGFEAVQKIIGNNSQVKAINSGFTTFAGMTRQAAQDKIVEQGNIQSNNRWLALLPVCLITLISYHLDLYDISRKQPCTQTSFAL
jgi:hypothetical protein